MDDVSAHRRLVKSPPELWAEISDAEALARRLGEFGEIRITRTRPETTVAWEGERARGTVEIESSGWGTRVVLTARPSLEPAAEPAAAPEPPPAPPAPLPAPERVERELHVIDRRRVRIELPRAAPPPPPEPEPPAAPEEPPRRGFLARVFGRKPVEPAVEPAKPPPPAPPQAPPPDIVTFTILQCAVATRVPERAAPPPPPAPAAPEPPAPTPAIDPERVRAVLEAVLDDLGTAHHRPFSRA